jgi:hypothetical protein
VPSLFQDGQVIPEALLLPELKLDVSAWSGLDAIVGYCQELEEPLEASCLVNYRRLSFQSGDGALRVTIDLGLSFHAPPEDLWTRTHALVRESLGPTHGGLGEAVLEVKQRAGTPAWLERALERAGVHAIPFSKFVTASEAVHGRA